MKALPFNIIRWFVVEALGTFLLALTALVVGSATLGYTPGYVGLYAPFAIGLVIFVLVCLFGGVSGAHFNPAVSVAVFSLRKIRVEQLITHLIAQAAGAWIGVMTAAQFLGFTPDKPKVDDRLVMMGEFIGAFVLIFTVCAVVLGRIREELAGLAVGAAIVVGISLALVTGGGVLNPAIAWSLGSTGLAFLLMPLLAGLVAAALAWLIWEANPTN